GLRDGALDLPGQQRHPVLVPQPVGIQSQLARQLLVEPDELGARRDVGPPRRRELGQRGGVVLVDLGHGSPLHRQATPPTLTRPRRGDRLASDILKPPCTIGVQRRGRALMTTPPPSTVRAANARACLLVLRDAREPLTLGELAASTGLSRPTVDAVLQDLAAAGTVASAAPAPSAGAGRPARRVAFVPSAASVAAIDIGARSVRCLVTDLAGTELARASVPFSAEAPVEALLAAVEATGHRPRAVGVAAPGILAADGRIAQSLAVPALVGLDPAALLEERLDCPVGVDNDIKLAALAEHHLGDPVASMLFVQSGHRIAVAAILGGRILQGAHRLAGELGSQRGMRWTTSSERGRLMWSTGSEAKPLLARAAAGEPAALAEVEE